MLEESQLKMRNSMWIVPIQENKPSCSTLRKKLQHLQVKKALFPLLVQRRNQDIVGQIKITAMPIELKGNTIHPLKVSHQVHPTSCPKEKPGHLDQINIIPMPNIS